MQVKMLFSAPRWGWAEGLFANRWGWTGMCCLPSSLLTRQGEQAGASGCLLPAACRSQAVVPLPKGLAAPQCCRLISDAVVATRDGYHIISVNGTTERHTNREDEMNAFNSKSVWRSKSLLKKNLLKATQWLLLGKNLEAEALVHCPMPASQQ